MRKSPKATLDTVVEGKQNIWSVTWWPNSNKTYIAVEDIWSGKITLRTAVLFSHVTEKQSLKLLPVVTKAIEEARRAC